MSAEQRTKRWKHALVVSTAVLTVFGTAGAAGADDGTVTGGDVSGSGSSATPAEERQADAKARFAEAYYAAMYEGGSAADLREAASAYEAAYPRAGDDSIEELATLAGSSAVVRRGERSVGLSESRMLPLVHKGQLKDYYCGPASGKMMLDVIGDGPSKITGGVKNQYNLADASHMRTDVNGRTGWDSSLFRIGMNKWRQGTPRGYYVENDSPAYADFKRMLVADIDRDYPIAADTVETVGDVPYNRHPDDRVIGHLIVGFGYAEFGDVVRFADPSSSIWGDRYGVRETFTTYTRNFVPSYLQENGIVW